MRRPRLRGPLNMDADDYSPTEVAHLGLLGIKRSDIYLRIRSEKNPAGDIETVRDALGHHRITRGEIERLQRKWKIDPAKVKMAQRDQQLEAAARRERARIASNANAARYTGAEIGARAIEGKHRHYAQQIDPERKLPPDELARMVKRAEDEQLARARLADIEREMLRRQYGQDPA